MAPTPRQDNLLQTRWIAPLLAFVLIGGLSAATIRPVAPAEGCATTLKVVTAASFAAVLSGIAPAVASGPDCARLDVVTADGRTAAARVADLAADVWIPDDASWAGIQSQAALAAAPAAGAGTVVATSPFYLVTDRATAQRVTAAGGGWGGLAQLVTGPPAGQRVTLALRDPAGSGDGMLAAGALGEAVWIGSGMDASAEMLSRALPAIRTLGGTEPALPRSPGEIGLVPEHALLAAARAGGAGFDAAVDDVLAPTDHTAALRYTWLPTAAAATDPARSGPLARLLAALTSADGNGALAAAGLRDAHAVTPPGEPEAGIPPVGAPMFDVLAPHHVDHVFATWYAEDRRADVLVAVDVSGSMKAKAAGSNRPLIDLVKDGFADLGRELPDDSELSLWEFGVKLAPPKDYQVLLPRAALTREHRAAIGSAVAALRADSAGTGLHDTILAAYTDARDRYRDGVPNHVVVFTDGRNEKDPGSLTREQLGKRLIEATDPKRPVRLTVVAFGDKPDAPMLKQVLEPIDGYVGTVSTAEQVGRAFVHVAAGGLHD